MIYFEIYIVICVIQEVNAQLERDRGPGEFDSQGESRDNSCLAKVISC